MELMMKQGFQEEGEAAGKWRRACLTSTQLSTYYVGNRELNRIISSYREKLRLAGSDPDPEEIHDRVLSFGSPPPRHLEYLLEL